MQQSRSTVAFVAMFTPTHPPVAFLKSIKYVQDVLCSKVYFSACAAVHNDIDMFVAQFLCIHRRSFQERAIPGIFTLGKMWSGSLSWLAETTVQLSVSQEPSRLQGPLLKDSGKQYDRGVVWMTKIFP